MGFFFFSKWVGITIEVNFGNVFVGEEFTENGDGVALADDEPASKFCYIFRKRLEAFAEELLASGPCPRVFLFPIA